MNLEGIPVRHYLSGIEAAAQRTYGEYKGADVERVFGPEPAGRKNPGKSLRKF